ncbi:hypothetical protein ABZ135_31335 [Streptomyces sp. NPDC006339]|uniref:hypothetical protein n=1 Tax=Streptomyces sp. NPDC006339 TaxID=3156755 RepID=UPI0033B1C10A
MSQLLHVMATLTDPHFRVPADGPVPAFTPSLPSNVSTPIQTILAWTAGLGLAGAVLGGLIGWALVAVGHNTERAPLAARGKQSILWSLIGAGGIGLTASLVMAFYGLAKGQ